MLFREAGGRLIGGSGGAEPPQAKITKLLYIIIYYPITPPWVNPPLKPSLQTTTLAKDNHFVFFASSTRCHSGYGEGFHRLSKSVIWDFNAFLHVRGMSRCLYCVNEMLRVMYSPRLTLKTAVFLWWHIKMSEFAP